VSIFVKKLLKESVVYSIGPILEKLIGIFLIPVYTAYLTPSDYGVLQYIMTIGAFLVPVIGAGLVTSFWRFRSDDTWDRGEVCLHVVIGQLMVGAFVVMCIIFVYFNAYHNVIGFLLTVYVSSRVLMIIYESTLLVLQAQHRVYFYLILSTLYALTLTVTNIVLIVVFELNYYGIIYSTFWVTIFFALTFSWPLIKEIKWNFNWHLLKELYKYGLPLAYANVAAIVIMFSDVIFLKWLSTDHEVGLYSFGYKFALLVNVFLITPFFKSWNPMRWEVYRQKDGKNTFSMVYDGLLVLLPFLALLVAAVAVLLASILSQNPDFLIGLMIVPVIAAAYVFYAVYYFNTMGLLFADRTKSITYIMMLSAGLNLILNYLFIPTYGMYGASVATLVSYICMAIISIVVSQKIYQIPKNRLLEIGQLILFSIIASSFLLLPDDLAVHSLSMFSLLVFLALVLLISGFMLNPKIFMELKKVVATFRNR